MRAHKRIDLANYHSTQFPASFKHKGGLASLAHADLAFRAIPALSDIDHTDPLRHRHKIRMG